MRVYLYERLAREILRRHGKVKISLDLGYSYKVVDLDKLKSTIGEEILRKIKGNIVHVWENGELFKVAIFTDHFYALKMYHFPILEIDGIRMHLIRFKHPYEYGEKVAKYLSLKRCDTVLETCVGLGYVTKSLLRAKRVVGYENKKEVVEIAKWNPFSQHLFSARNLDLKVRDVVTLDDFGFTKISHDPPTAKTAPFLYSRPFYRLLFEKAVEGAVLHHYIGYPGKRRGREFKKEVERRLSESGWYVFFYSKELESLFAERKKYFK